MHYYDRSGQCYDRSMRREELLDAAIALLGEHGVHRLTHRGVDSAAGVPAGTTSNYFRTREALIGAVVERFAARERANWDDIAAAEYPTTSEELIRVLVEAVRGAVGPHRTLTLARFAILVETAIHPELRQQITGPAQRVNAWATAWMRVIGSAHPERDARILGAFVDGTVLHQLSNPDPDFDPAERITTVVESLNSKEVHHGA
jgi:AcrR family transcriptional regulator